MTYSVAIRTLGLNPGLLRQVLESVFVQTQPPDRVVVYIARGYQAPGFRVGYEDYVWVEKGMVAQRAVDYREIDSELILLLDDDVVLSADSAEKMMHAISHHTLDCVAADVFANHKMPLSSKIYAALSNLTFPHLSHKWAFRIRPTGSFSYCHSPKAEVMMSQSGGGPCSMWRKDSLLGADARDEVWLDSMGFPFGEDALLMYKLYRRGGRLGVHFDAGVFNMDGKTSSDAYRGDPRRFFYRAKASFVVWHRMLYACERNGLRRFVAAAAFAAKSLWQVPVHIVAGVYAKDVSVPAQYIRGLIHGLRFVKTGRYKSLPPYLK